MDVNKVGVGQSVAWVGCGWRIFMKKPGMWIVFSLVFFLMSLLMALPTIIPMLGDLVTALLNAVLYGGLFYAVYKVDSTGELEVGNLFEGFRNHFGALLGIGGVSILAIVLAVVLMLLLVELTLGLGLLVAVPIFAGAQYCMYRSIFAAEPVPAPEEVTPDVLES